MESAPTAQITNGFGDSTMQHLNNLLTQQILFINDLETIIGKDRLTLRRWWTDGKFPMPVKLHGRTLAWHKDVIEEWITKNMRQSNNSFSG